jgi:hypothetical protein
MELQARTCAIYYWLYMGVATNGVYPHHITGLTQVIPQK